MKYLVSFPLRKSISNFHLNQLNYSFLSRYSSTKSLINDSLCQKNDLNNCSFDKDSKNVILKNSLVEKINKNQTRLFTTTSLNRLSTEQETADPYKKPTKEQLLLLKEKLVQILPKFMVESHPYNLYTANVVFENYYSEPGKITEGALQYAIQLLLLRMKINWKFSYSRIEVLKVTIDELEGAVKVRWRLVGVRGLKSMVQPWKVKVWNVKDTIKNESEWNDGFSIFYVRGDGLIYKHTLQRVMSQKDEEPVVADSKAKKVENLDVNNTICTKH
ncbi:unnamed protein product [Brachionus calyciflorus]|uniref:Uncharacterized protein n=1 Tax=Brachionus calyciflorus TaxID=104777 RepID=A0A813PWS7_9BILA|nr:unnamed protein product [Brachionus calyciflorus]